jgi:uncharacterized protein YneF (UPF0154 family)
MKNTIKIIGLALLLNGTMALASTKSSRQQIISAVKDNPEAVLDMLQDHWDFVTTLEAALRVGNATLVHELFAHQPKVDFSTWGVVDAALGCEDVDLFEFVISKTASESNQQEKLDHAINIYLICFNQEEFKKPYFNNVMIKHILNRIGVRPSHACILSCYEAFKKYPKDHLIEEEKTKLEELLEILRVAAFPNPS